MHADVEENQTSTSEQVPGVLEENHKEVKEPTEIVGNQETGSTSTELQEAGENVPVKVIQEDLDAPSALVHMISSDTPESSMVEDQVTLAEKDVLQEQPPPSSGAQFSTFPNKNIIENEVSQQSNDFTATEEKQRVTPPLRNDDDDSSPVPPKEETPTLGLTGIHVTPSPVKPEGRTDLRLDYYTAKYKISHQRFGKHLMYAHY